MKFLSKENVLQSYKKAIKSRKNKEEFYIFNTHLEENILKILSDIKNRSYKHQSYRLLIINDNKKRYISSPCLWDHILHHMIYNICYPVLDKRIPYNSFATRLGKGQHKAVSYFLNKIRKIDLDKYNCYMKMDFSKYFYSIPHETLKQKIFKYIKNEDLRYAINMVIESYKSCNRYDYLFDEQSYYRKIRNKGLPIGAIHSKLFANFYLYDLDHYINQNLKPTIYLRYMDDLIFVDTIDNLRNIKTQVLEFVDNSLLLNMNPRKIGLNKLSFGISLLGYKIKVKDNTIITQVNRRNKRKFWRNIDLIKKLDFDCFADKDLKRIESLIASRKSMFIHTDNYENYVKDSLDEIFGKIKG